MLVLMVLIILGLVLDGQVDAGYDCLIMLVLVKLMLVMIVLILLVLIKLMLVMMVLIMSVLIKLMLVSMPNYLVFHHIELI